MTKDFYLKGIEKLFYIINKDMESIPFVLNPPQKRILNELGNMDIILKARQEGISSLVLAMFALDFITVENMRCVVISHEEKATRRLLDRVKYFLKSMEKTWPGDPPFMLKYNSRYEMLNTEKNSSFYIGTAGARAFGHGDTINNLHISELSRWSDQENTMVGLLQAVPKDGRIIIETTANGFGDYFYKLWNKNSQTQSPFKTHFIPWFELPDYVMPCNDLMELTDGNPNYGDEIQIMNTYGLKREQMAWRRWKIDQLNGNIDKFNEQFPATAEEAFIVSGNPVWSPSLMKWYLLKTKPPVRTGNLIGFTPITLDENEKGYLKVWKTPKEFHQYVIGVDVSEGKIVTEMEGGKERDYSCAQVLDKTTYEQVAIWHGRIDPDILGRHVDLLGRWYNDALVAVERNSIGLTPLIVLRDLNYPNIYYREKIAQITEKITADLGWVTDSHSKEVIVNDATNIFRDKRLTINDEETVGEMMSFVRDADGHAGATRSAYDDRVMALLIAIRMLTRPQGSFRGNPIESEEVVSDGGFTMNGVPFDENGWPTQPSGFD